MAGAATTYDGLAVAEEPPFGATVVVYRRRDGNLELLLLHRAHHGPDHEGDWAWTAPSGARLPNEPPEAAAARELEEETGLRLPFRQLCDGADDWFTYAAEAPADVVVVLNAEHDRLEWLAAAEALARCRPQRVAAQLQMLLTALS